MECRIRAGNSPFANAGIVVTVEEKDLVQYRTDEALAGLRFQEEVERTVFAGVVSGQIAPAQRMTDLTSRKISKSLATNILSSRRLFCSAARTAAPRHCSEISKGIQGI